MKKIIYFLFLFLLIPLFINISAESTHLSDDGKSSFTPTQESTRYIDGVTYNQMFCTSTSNAVSGVGNQMINEFEMKTDGINSKLVSWAIQSGLGGYTRSTLTHIAENYEEKHPGWKVVAGINGDQYFQYYGHDIYANGSFYFVPQPYYPLIIDGERRFAETITGNHTNTIGLKNNGQANSFAYSSDLDGFYLEILDDNGNIKTKHKIDKVNETPDNGEISVWMGYISGEDSSKFCTFDINTSNNLYIVEEAELAYMFNSRFYDIGSQKDSLFGRGIVSKIDDTFTTNKWSFAVESNNDSLELNVGNRIRIQSYYQNNELNDVESSFGYHSTQRFNNQDIDGLGSYDTTRYNRSVFGKKADGTYVLMTVARGNVNGGTYSGMSQHETNAVLKYYGVNEAYQQDGGGSVTAIIRNDTDGFDVVNESSDSSIKERSILMGCFFVVRDSEYRLYGKDVTRTSIKLSKVGNVNDKIISDIYAEVNNKKYYPSDNGDINIDNLEDDTKYTIYLRYKVDGKVNTYTIFNTKTDSFVPPKSGIEIKDINGTKLTLTYSNRYYSELIDTKVLIFPKSNQDKKLEHIYTSFNEEYTFTGLEKNTEYILQVNYTVKDPLKGTNFDAVEEIEFKTLESDIPELVQFNVVNIDNNKVKIEYKVIDPDNLVGDIYISYYKINPNEPIIEFVEGTEGSIELEVNLQENDKFTFSLNYVHSLNKKVKSEDVEISYDSSLNKSQEKKKKCSKKAGLLVIELLSILNMLLIIKRKK